MSEESPAQRSARLRRERREAKIKEGGSARLDKITSLSGRTPQSEREDASPSPQRSISASPSPAPPMPQFRPSPSPQSEMQSPEAQRAQQEAFLAMLQQSASGQAQGQQPDSQAEALQAQQDAFRAMLRQSAPEQGQSQGLQSNDAEDPAVKLLSSLLGAMPGGAPPSPGSSLATMATMAGVPPFLANMLGGAAAPTEAEQKSTRIWKTLHTVFALAVSFYLLFLIGTSVSLFGSPPPKPATAQNPFAIFVTGELLLTGGKVLFGGKSGGMGMAVQLSKDVIRDGKLLLFVLGLASWYHPEWQASASA
ncbi:hypothetical protein N7467_005067 [Penicillium canescens]|nr:hypothetical protein N7467_005067 [Penicillium canescens]